MTSLGHASGTTTFEISRAITIDPELPLPELMDRYASYFRSLIDEFHPDVVAARQVWKSTNLVAAMCQVAPLGIAAYVCHEKTTLFKSFTPQALRQATRFNLPKGTDPLSAVDNMFGSHPPYWDDMQRASLLVAWRALLESNP